jgi:hypothetical protein
MTSDHIIAAATLDTNAAIYIIDAFVIPFEIE